MNPSISEPKFNPSIFREYDIRGIADRDLTTELARTLGFAYADFLRAAFKDKKPANGRGNLTVAVGRDCRLSGERLSSALIEGLRDAGIDVITIGVCPTPLTYFSVFHLDLDGAIMVTGSHNPKDYNGFKICVGKDTLHGHQIQELRLLAERSELKPAAVKGSFSETAIIPPYWAHLEKVTARPRKLKVVLDAGNGTAGSVAPTLFRNLGCDVIELYCDLDGRFPNHHPDPTVPSNLKELVATVKREGADFGVGFDGDSDRIGVVDDSGRILFGDELMVLLARDVLKSHPGATIISEVKSSGRLYADIAQHGGKPLMWKTGHSLIKSKMKETGAKLAGEMSGHIFFADRYFGFDDAIYAAVRVLEIVSSANAPLSTLLSDLPPAVATPEIRLECDEAKKFALVEAAKKRLRVGHSITDIDGVRVDFGDAWGLVRASNTQPVLVLRFEAPSHARLDEVRHVVEGALLEAARELGHGPLKAESH